MTELRNIKMSEEDFFKQREEVLSQWRTGKSVDLKEAVDYLKKVPDYKNFAKKMRWARENGITLAQPRAGVALINEHIELLNTKHIYYRYYYYKGKFNE